MKKYMILMLILFLLLACTLLVSAASAMKCTPSNVTAHTGDMVIIPVNISSNTGFVSASLIVEYDDSVFTLTGVNDRSLINGAAHTTRFSSPYILSWENDLRTSNYTANGTLVELVFTVSSFAEPGDYNIRVSTPTHGILNHEGSDVHSQQVQSLCLMKNALMIGITGQKQADHATSEAVTSVAKLNMTLIPGTMAK